jgi:hypothetical protein
MQRGPFHHQRQAQDRHTDKLCRAVDDPPHRRVLDADSVHAGHKRTEPVREVDDVGAGDAGEEVLGAAGEPHDLVGKTGPQITSWS